MTTLTDISYSAAGILDGKHDSIRALVALSVAAGGPNAALVQRLRNSFAAEVVREASLKPGPLAQRLSRVDVDAVLDAADAVGARFIPGDRLLQLADLPVPPIGLWVRGRTDLPMSGFVDAVAVVGSRACTAGGRETAHRFAFDLARAGRRVVSGAAYGIDAAAHRGAIDAGGVTVAVLPSGVDRPYPVAYAPLIERIATDGLVISEYAPGAAPARQSFLDRNRIIGALSGSMLVVEASHRSGSLNAARQAREIGRPIFAVPGPVSSDQSTGTNNLLSQGLAAAVTDAGDLP
ncbi:DNA processing protein [Branchiibius hedensis]|uniref:DNA processing protein n=2 Tax=Branchiibius TaxID=908251 RepID=A0A2Y8ZQ46_9MICO|nr:MULTISPECIES: DNA-processing protein DprA [Branchiibius]KYH44773.1 hypothetical protein AZH51_12160 [Branchiibius sp. NY16-3462-2]PWJ25647.1 DNA processing protein [Branchiibius hedensis]SSA34460.1 DNA processing protein [Branchiibius hedensis]